MLFDAATVPVKLTRLLKEAGGTPEIGQDPTALMKARKNAAEFEGSRAAHLRDGAAIVRFLHWFDTEAPKGKLTEIDAARALETFRRETGKLKDLSFPTISAAGPHSAIPHYRVSEASNRKISRGIYLVDSGGQYEDGTTDITRTLAVGHANAGNARSLHPRAEGSHRHRPRVVSERHVGRPDRCIGTSRALASRHRFRPRHGPRRRLLPLGARGAAAHLENQWRRA